MTLIFMNNNTYVVVVENGFLYSTSFAYPNLLVRIFSLVESFWQLTEVMKGLYRYNGSLYRYDPNGKDAGVNFHLAIAAKQAYVMCAFCQNRLSGTSSSFSLC